MTTAETRDQEVTELSSDSHRVERLVRLKSVAGALEMLVPQLD